MSIRFTYLFYFSIFIILSLIFLSVLCNDLTCVESVNQCPDVNSCPEELINCPDKTCASTFAECGLSSGCPLEIPYKCWDNTCRIRYEDCPPEKSCGNGKYLCNDGNCVDSIDFCKNRKECLNNKDYMIDSLTGSCITNRPTVGNLSLITYNPQCTNGLMKCTPYNECVANRENCYFGKCPDHLPYKCTDGKCTDDPNTCSVYDCDLSKIVLCHVSGTGTFQYSCCSSSSACCSPTIPNPDPTQISIFGCPLETPYRCFDGTCVNSWDSCFTGGFCPDNMIKCPNGLCMTSSKYCPEMDNSRCSPDTPIYCANGQCVRTYDECRTIKPCNKYEVRCDNGECRPKTTSYQVTDLCPNDVQICLTQMCKSGPSSGMCVSDLGDCIDENNPSIYLSIYYI